MLLLNCWGVGAVGVPVRIGDASGAFSESALVNVTANFASLPRAAANSLRVSSAAGDEAIRAAMAVLTKAVLATFALLSPAAWVGALRPPAH